MGSLSLLAQATSLTLAHLFVKAETTPTPCFPLQRVCAGLCGAGMGSESPSDVLSHRMIQRLEEMLMHRCLALPPCKRVEDAPCLSSGRGGKVWEVLWDPVRDGSWSRAGKCPG